MTTTLRFSVYLSTLFAVFTPTTSAHAFNGYFASGYGIKAKGMSGARTAIGGDAFAAGNNPAASLFSGDRLEFGIEQAVSRQTSERFGSGGRSDVRVSGTEYGNFPEFGYNRVLSPDLSIGFSIFRNGLVQTYYPNNEFFNILPVPANKVSDQLAFLFSQDVVAPTVSFRIGEESSIGISPLYVRQTLQVDGMHAVISENLSRYPGNVTNKGTDDSDGVGFRLGFMSRLTDKVMIGATYSPKIRMSSFDRYKGLFTDNAHFDVPENFSLGTAIVLNPVTVLSIDYQRIRYGGVKLLSVPSTVFGTNPGAQLMGDDDGPGFGWDDVGIWKLGYEWRYRSDLTFRFGFSRNNSPVKQRDVTLAVLMPNITTQEQSLGATYKFDQNREASFYYARSTGPKITGGIDYFFNSNIPESIEVKNHSFGFQFGFQF